MEQNYILMTDSDSDFPFEIAREKNIPVVKMPYTLDGVEYFDDNGESGAEKQLFDRMRAGAKPVTSLLPTAVYLDYFEPILKEKDLLFIAFSSKMSMTFQNVLEARDELLKKYPERKMIVVDTLSITFPQTLLVLEAHRLYKAGATIEEVERWLLDNRLKAQVWVTVDDLAYLRRGGRISLSSAFMGTMLDIKPILTLNREGKLDAAMKVQGRKKAMKTLVEKTAEMIENPEDQVVYILHGDVESEAEMLKTQLKNRVNIKEIRVRMLGPVIGSHAGPGTLGVAFMGKER